MPAGGVVNGERKVFWAERNTVIAFGVLTVVFWLSRAVFPQRIPPLAPMPKFGHIVAEVKSAAPWIQHAAGLDADADEIQRSLRREYVTTIAVMWLKVALGVTSGVLIARRRRKGRWIAIALCAVLLVQLLFTEARLALEGRFTGYWRAYAEFSPRLVVASVAALLFYAGSVLYLTRRRVGTQFSTR